MAMLSDVDIRTAIRDRLLKIEPFDEKRVEPASYDLQVGRVLLPGRGVVELTTAGISLRPNEWAEIETLERMELPNDVAANFGLRSSVARRGILAFGGPQVDPGYRGRLFVGLFNPSSEAFTVQPGPLITVQFIRLEHAAARAYSGQYQGMDRFPEEDIVRLMNLRGPSLADVVHSVGVLENAVHELRTVVGALRDEMRGVRMQTGLVWMIAAGILVTVLGGLILHYALGH